MKSAHVPALKHDAMMAACFGSTVSPNGRLERCIVANLIAHLAKHQWHPHSVFDGDDEIMVHSGKAAMELIFNLDEASVRFWKESRTHWHGILLVLGNGIDIVSDWNYSEGDADGFNAAMDLFDAEQYA